MRRIAVMAVALAVVVAACGIRGDGPVQRIPNDSVPFGLADTTTSSTTTTSTTLPEQTSTSGPTTTLVTEQVQLYFVDGGQISPLPIPLVSPASLNQVLFALQEGPPSSAPVAGLRTALPSTDVTITAGQDGTGVATVDLPADFFEIVTGLDQRLAVAQIVLTLANRPGVGQVRFTQSGEPAVVQRGSGALAEPGEPLAVRDFASLLDTPVVDLQATSTSAPTTTTAP
jgi:spore germination protein GerM